MKKAQEIELENSISYSSFDKGESKELININMRGKAYNTTELHLNAVKLLVSHIDVKHACSEDPQIFTMVMDQILLAIAEQIGVEGAYNDLPDELVPYNPETGEIEVSERINWLILKEYIEGKLKESTRKRIIEH